MKRDKWVFVSLSPSRSLMQLACKTDKQIQCTVALLNSFRYSRRNNWKSNWKLWGEAQLFFCLFFGISLDSRYCKKRRKTPVTCIWSQVAKMQFSLRVFFYFSASLVFRFSSGSVRKCIYMHISIGKSECPPKSPWNLKPIFPVWRTETQWTVAAGPTPRETSYSSC